MSRVVLSIGSNLGDRLARLQAAVDAIGDAVVTVSPVWESDAWGGVEQQPFLNAALIADDPALDGPGWLRRAQQIERDNERVRTQRWGPRTLDIDLIAHGQAILPDLATYDHWRTLPLDAQKTDVPAKLILPHPRLQDRAFVLVPLADVAPDWVHPTLGQSVSEMVTDLTDAARAEITLL